LDLSEDRGYFFSLSLYTNSRMKMSLPQVSSENKSENTIKSRF